MIAQPNSPAGTMLRALAYTIAALDAASELDVDLSDDDRTTFVAEKTELVPLLDNLLVAQQAFNSHMLKQVIRLQARAVVGDSVLDRGVRNAKFRMKLETKPGSKDAEFVFGPDLRDIIDAEIRHEPSMVQGCAARLQQVPDFSGRTEMKRDLEERALMQLKVILDRDSGGMDRAALSSAIVRATADGSEALYRLEKRMLDRFPRERTYVRGFFFDIQANRKPTKETAPQSK